jgi:hypothetical protein
MRRVDWSIVVLMLAVVISGAFAQDLGSVSNSTGVQMFVVAGNVGPSIRIVLPGHATTDHAIEMLFPEHVTAVRHGASTAEHLFMFRQGPQGEQLMWRHDGQALEYERDLPGLVHFLARATLEEDGILVHYELSNRSAVDFDMITAVTDPRLISLLHDERLERTYVHHDGGLELLASETPSRLTMPLAEWLPARYHASLTWPIPEQRVQRQADGITYYYKSRAVDTPFIATRSTDGAWVVASFTRDTGNAWSNPGLTCQHVDPQTSLAAGQRAILELKILIIRGSVEDAFQRMQQQRQSLR